jgi:superfamily II DNA or RNA helicase
MVNVNEIKSKIQKEALDAWVEAGEKGLLLLFTGFGKTKLGVDAILREKQLTPKSKILIVVPSTSLRDVNWIEQIVDWGAGHHMPDIRIECINTAYKLEKEKFDLIILDEVHLYLSDEFKKVHNIETKKTLALTATIPQHDEEKTKLLAETYPIVYNKSLQDGIDLGLVSPFKVYNLAVPFTKREQAMYNSYNTKFNNMSKELKKYIDTLKDKGFDISANPFELSKVAMGQPDHPMHEEAKDYWKAMGMRKWVCFNAYYKRTKAKKIIENFPDKKWIIFSESTRFVDSMDKDLGDISVKYHSKMKSEEREKALKKATEEDIKAIVAAKALSQGYNLPMIDGGISASGSSVELRMIQELGRIVRLKDGKQAIFINLYVPNTQEEVWVRKKTENLNPTFVTKLSEIW